MVAFAYEKRRLQEIPSTGLWLERFDDLDWSSIMGGGRPGWSIMEDGRLRDHLM